MYVRVRDRCIRNCDLQSYVIENCASLQDHILPELKDIVFEYLAIV